MTQPCALVEPSQGYHGYSKARTFLQKRFWRRICHWKCLDEQDYMQAPGFGVQHLRTLRCQACASEKLQSRRPFVNNVGNKACFNIQPLTSRLLYDLSCWLNGVWPEMLRLYIRTRKTPGNEDLPPKIKQCPCLNLPSRISVLQRHPHWCIPVKLGGRRKSHRFNMQIQRAGLEDKAEAPVDVKIYYLDAVKMRGNPTGGGWNSPVDHT